MKIKIIDSTLREGRQSKFFDTIFKIQDDYLDIISRMGVFDVEYRNPSVNKEELENYRRLKNKFPKINFHVHIFLNRTNIDWVISDPSVEYISTFIKLPATETSLDDLLFLIKGTSKKIRVGIENVAFISNEMLKWVVDLLKGEETVDRIAFSDTLGNFTSEKIHTFIEQINTIGLNNKNIEFHLHNDYGLAASNAVQLLSETDDMATILYFSTSMLGLGERNGILSYGDLLSNIVRLKIPHTMNLKVYGELTGLMEANNICFNRDPVSDASFSHFASSHIIGETGKNKYHNISPDVFGMRTRFIFNELTGQNVFKQIAQDVLQKSTSDDGSLIKNYVIEKMRKQNCPTLPLEEVIRLLREFYSNKTV